VVTPEKADVFRTTGASGDRIYVDFPPQIPANTIYFIILLAIGWVSRFNRFHPSRKTHLTRNLTTAQ